jgi:hypothetical protein
VREGAGVRPELIFIRNLRGLLKKSFLIFRKDFLFLETIYTNKAFFDMKNGEWTMHQRIFVMANRKGSRCMANDKTFYVQIKKKRLLTNLKSDNVYPKQRLIDEFNSIVAELEKQSDEVFLVNFISSPFLCLAITSYKEIDK